MNDNPLGKPSSYADRYQPDLLYAVARSEGRATLGLDDPLPFHGVDVWTMPAARWSRR